MSDSPEEEVLPSLLCVRPGVKKEGPGPPPGSNTLHVIEREALILN